MMNFFKKICSNGTEKHNIEYVERFKRYSSLIIPYVNAVATYNEIEEDPTSYEAIRTKNRKKEREDSVRRNEFKGFDDLEFLSFGYPILTLKAVIPDEVNQKISNSPVYAEFIGIIKIEKNVPFLINGYCLKFGYHNSDIVLQVVPILREITSEIGYFLTNDGSGSHAFYKLPCGGIRGYSPCRAYKNTRIFKIEEEM